MGMSKQTIAFDIGLGCSGYIYGLSVIGSMMATGRIKKALLFTGDISTLNTSYRDKSAFPLFGDAGTATAISYDKAAEPMAFNLQTDGSGYDAIIIPDGGIRNFPNKETSFEYKQISDGIFRNGFNIALDGIKVFNFSLREVKRNINELADFANLTLDQIDFLVLHQANKLMNDTIRKQLKQPEEKMPMSLETYGNTSSASIPLTMVTQMREILETSTNKLLLSGFGVGLSWGSAILETSHIQCPPILIHPNS
jgi:3-oxoacyl-[acyl-carrier-protein] synthase-3